MIIQKFKDVPEIYKPELKELIDKGILKGFGGSGDDLVINLTEEDIRVLIIAKRMIEKAELKL